MRRPSKPKENPPCVRVYGYGLLPPRGPLGDIATEDRKLVDLWNALVEMGERSRAQWEKTLLQDPAVALAAKTQADRERELNETRERLRKLQPSASPEQKATLRSDVRTARVALRESARTVRALRKSAQSGFRTVRDALIGEREARIAELIRNAKTNRIHWSFVGALVDSWRTTWAQALQGKAGFPRHKRPQDPPPPYVFRYTQGGCPLSRLFNPISRLLRIEVPPAQDPPPTLSRSARRRWLRKKSRGKAYFRIGEKTYEFGIVLHRRPPKAALVKKATLSRALRFPTRPGSDPRWDWSLLLTVEQPSAPAPPHPHPGTVAAFAPGWRRMDGRIRAAVCVSPEGVREDLWLPDKVLLREERARRLQGIVDLEVDRLKERIRPLLESLATTNSTARNSLASWELVQAAGLLRLAVGLDGDGNAKEISEALADWSRRRLRILSIRRRILGHLRRHRSWWWQNAAIGLCQRFATLVVPDLDLSRLVRRKPFERSAPGQVDARSTANLHLVGHHEGKKWLREMALKTGTVVLDLPSKFIGARCSACGGCSRCRAVIVPRSDLTHECEAEGDDARDLGAEMECPLCKAVLDRSENAARNLLSCVSSEKSDP